jgi:aspartate ammonia-lyase
MDLSCSSPPVERWGAMLGRRSEIMATRIERDSLGEFEVPAEAYYGIQTRRAVQNFPISGLGPWPEFVDAVVHIKKAAARVHKELGAISPDQADAIVSAADEILAGRHRDQFVVDVFQAGAGTSHHMNVNEVLANRAGEMLGTARGDYSRVHPNDHVNFGQSTNDVIPTAIRLAGLVLARALVANLDLLAGEFAKKGVEFRDVIKSGRTHLQDAVPVTLGQEFAAFAQIIRDHRRLVTQAAEELRSLGIGGSAAGTGLNTLPRYPELMAKALSEQLGTEVHPATDLLAAMQSMAPFVAVSSALRNLALDLIKIANDVRLLASGPLTGLAEIELPAVQPGSSIMPGKVNPVLPEMLCMVGFQVVGSDATIALASQAGQLELNVMMPIIAFDLLFEFRILSTSVEAFASKCVAGIEANAGRCREFAELSLSNVTVLNPYLGYAKAAAIAKRALVERRPLREIVLEENLMTPDELDRILDLKAMADGPSEP